METWTFLTNYGHVLLCIAADPEIRMKDIADKVGITERSAQRIVADLISEGYVTQVKVGRRNRYDVRLDLPLRHPIERENQVGVLLKLLGAKPANAAPARKPRKALPSGPK
jgi:DNA-binding Lrp family transcriptional regulator